MIVMQIPCPWCNQRDEVEFKYGGESHITRPDPTETTDAGWADYLFNRRNPKGVHYERWCHSYGCGQWFNVVRDTVTHKVHAVYKMDELAPDTLEAEK